MEEEEITIEDLLKLSPNQVVEEEEKEVVVDSPSMNVFFNDPNVPLTSVLSGNPLNLSDPTLDENGVSLLGTTSDVTEDGIDAQELQETMLTKAQLLEISKPWTIAANERVEKVNGIVNQITEETVLVNRNQTAEHLKRTTPIGIQNYQEVMESIDLYNQNHIDKYKVPAGYALNRNIDGLEADLSEVINNANIISYVNRPKDDIVLSAEDQYLGIDLNEQGLIVASSLLEGSNYNLDENEDWNKTLLDKIKKGTHGYNPKTRALELLEEPIDSSDNTVILDGYTDDFQFGELNDPTTNLDDYNLIPSAKANMMRIMLEDEAEGTNMRDLFIRKDLDTFEKFSAFTQSKFKKITMADPVLNGYKELVTNKLQLQLAKKQAEINNTIIAPCAEKNEGIATSDCLLQANAEIAQWWNSEWEKNYTNNPHVLSTMNQYKIGYAKLMNSIAKPYNRSGNDTYREIDDRMQREGMNLSSLSKDALARLGFSMDQTGALINILYQRSGVTGDTKRKEVLDAYSYLPADITEALNVETIGNTRGGLVSSGFTERDHQNKINLNQAYNLSSTGVFGESQQLRNYSSALTSQANANYEQYKDGEKIFYTPGQVEYIMHGGAGTIAARPGSIQIKTREEFDKYFPEGNPAAVKMLNTHGQLWFSPITNGEWGNMRKVTKTVDKWAVAGGGGGSWFNQTAVARFYGGTGSRLEDITLRDMFVGRDDKDYASILDYDKAQNLKLFENTSNMLTAEMNSGLALTPDTEFNDVGNLIRHLVGQADTMLPMYAGAILDSTGKYVSKLNKPIGYGMQGTGKVLKLLGSMNMMAKEFTSNLVTSWRETIKLENGGKEPTREEFIKLMTSSSTDEMIMKSLVGSAAMTAMEKLGVDATLFGLRNPGGALIASLYRKEILKFIKQMPRAAFNTGISAGGEGLTEGIQGWIHDMTVNWSLGMGLGDNLSQSNFDMEGFQVGWRIGLALPIPAAIMQQTSVEINQIGMDVASKLILDPRNSTSIFSPMAAANNFFTESINGIKKKMKDGTISESEGRSVIESLSNSRNLGMKIPVTMAVEQRREYLDLLITQDKLKKQIEETDNKQISEGNGNIKALEDVNNKIVALTEQEVIRELYFNKVGKIDKIIENNSNGKVKLYKEKDTAKVNERISELKLDGWKIKKQNKNNADYGNIYQKGDQQVIILNEAEIVKDGTINTGAHEFLHAIIYQTVKNSKGTAIDLGNNLLQYIKKINPELLKKGKFKDRYEQYKNDDTVTDAVMGEEILTLFSEAVLDGAITIDQGLGDTFKGIVRRIFQTVAPNSLGKINFSDGKQIYNFIKDYNKSVEKGKLTTAQDNLLNQRAEGDLVKREYKTKDIKDRDTDSKSSQGFDKTNELFADPDFEATNRFDQKKAVEAAGGVIEAATKRLWRQGSLLTRDQFKKALENEYVQALVEYDSDRDTGTGAGSSISSKFNLRAGGVAKANLGKGESLSLDSEQAKQVADRTEQREFDEVESKENTQRKKVYSSNTNQVGNLDTAETKAIIKEEVSKDILLSANKGNNAADTARIIANEAKQNYFKKLRKDIGTFSSQTYKDFVNSLDKNFIKSLPVSIIKRRFGKLFGIKQTGIAKTKQTSKTGKPSYFNKPVFSVPKVTNEGLQQFKDYFLAGEKRQQSLYNILATDFALESLQELMSDKTFMDKLQTSLGNQGITAKEFMQNIENKLDARTVEDTSLDVVKASKKYKRTAKIVEPTIKDYMSDKGLEMYSIKGQKFEHDKFTDDQIKARDESVLLTIPEFGLDFYEFTNSTSGKTRSSDSFGGGNGRTIFNFNAGNNIDQLKDLLNAPLTGAFIEANREYVKKYTKTIGNDVFLDKNKLKKGSSLSAKDITVLKIAESEQGKYAKLSPEKRIELLRDKKFRKNQAEKSKILKKILNVINKNVRKDGKIIPGRMEFWASWINSQVNNSKHVMRVLAPIEFFSLSKIPKRSTVEGYKLNKKGEVISVDILNYVAEHLTPANNAAKIAVDLIYNNTVNKDFSLIKDNYVQGQLLKTDDVIVGKAGYTSQFPSEFWNMDKPNVWVRYLLGNPNINLNEYVTYKDGKVITIAESLGLPLDKSLRNPDSINFQNKLLKEVLLDNKTIASAKAELKDSQIVNQKSSKKVNVNQKTLFNLITPNSTTEASVEAMGNADKTVELGNKASKKRKGISVFDFDDTLAFSKSMVIVNMPDGTTTKISPAQFASEAELLEQNGAEFDFTEFEKVVKGRKGPLADLALKRQDKFGSGDIFVLTARPQASAVSIKKFLEGIGLNLPIENITGLANGSPDAKALWVLDKTAKGYNDFYFADDALANVQAVKNILDQVDVKSEVQQAKASKKRNLNKEFNRIIEQQSGKEWFKTYSDSRAKVEGKAKNKFEFFIPPSAEDFTGLLYKILPKGEKGNLAKQWIQDNLLDPFNKAEQLVIKAKIAVANDFQELRKNIKNVPKNLSKQSGYSKFTFSQALRVHIWTMQGMEIPGLSTRDKNALNKLIEQDPALKVFAEKIAFIQKGKEYPGPTADWVSGSITSDIINGIQKVYRKEALQEWQDNVDVIFSKDNMNKLEAIYGSNFTIALNNMLSRMKSGSNRPVGGNAQVENVMDWLNNSGWCYNVFKR